MKRLRLALCVLVSVVVSASGPPDFKDYPAAQIFRDKPAPPLLSTREARNFRTELRRQAGLGPNFAGHFTLAMWGCGAGCVTVAIVDARSGEVRFAPFVFEDAWGEDQRVICHHASGYEIGSELLVVQGKVNGRVGTHYFRWHRQKFKLVHYDSSCSP
jgi:hypothetical protein